MEFKMELDVELKDSKLSDYDELLSMFGKVWQKNKRDITITSLLNEGKKLEFVVSIDSYTGLIFLHNENNAYIVVSEFIFILQDNHVLSLKLKIDNSVKLNQKLLNDDIIVKQHMENGNVKYFYIEDEK